MNINDATFMRILEYNQDALLSLKKFQCGAGENTNPLHWYNNGYNEGRAQGKIDILEFLLEEFGEP